MLKIRLGKEEESPLYLISVTDSDIYLAWVKCWTWYGRPYYRVLESYDTVSEARQAISDYDCDW